MVAKPELPGEYEEKKKSSFYRALPQILAVAVKNVLLIVFGMTLGFPTILIPGLSGIDPEESFVLGPEAISWVSSINLICVPVGSVLSGPLTQPLGRRRAMQLVNIPFLAAWTILRFSSDVWQVFVAMSLTGLAGGLLEAPVLTYVAEITQPQLRGMLSSTSTMSILVGVLFQFLLGTFFKWRTVAFANLFLPALAFTLLFFIPESPHWLIMKNRYLDARKSLAWLRGWTSLEAIEPEFKELARSLNRESDNHSTVDSTTFEGGSNKPKNNQIKKSKPSSGLQYKLLLNKSFYWPYSIVCLVFFLGHFSGMTTLQTYAVQIFATLEIPIDIYYATVLLGSVELIGSIICVACMKFTGKRKLSFVSMIGSGICFAIAGIYAFSINVQYLYMPKPNNPDNTTIVEIVKTAIDGLNSSGLASPEASYLNDSRSLTNSSFTNPILPNSSFTNSSFTDPPFTNSSFSSSLFNSSFTNSSLANPSISNSSLITSIVDNIPLLFSNSPNISFDSFPSNISNIMTPLENLTVANVSKIYSDFSSNPYSWIPMVSLVLSAFISHVCIRTLPWILIGEVFSHEIRSIASGLSGAIGYIFGFLANKVFISMVNSLTLPGTFWFYAAINFIGCLSLYFVLPETEGKPLSEITNHFSGALKMDNKVRRKRRKERATEMGVVNVGYIDNINADVRNGNKVV